MNELLLVLVNGKLSQSITVHLLVHKLTANVLPMKELLVLLLCFSLTYDNVLIICNYIIMKYIIMIGNIIIIIHHTIYILLHTISKK